MAGVLSFVGEGGLEPPRACAHWHLKPARLPIPPPALGCGPGIVVGVFGYGHVANGPLAGIHQVMRFARRVERLLESAVDRVAGKVFPGGLQPTELAGRVVRAVDLDVRDADVGPSAPNVVQIVVAADELGDDQTLQDLEQAFSAALEEEAASRGWRLGGPAAVRISRSTSVDRGVPTIRTGRKDGPRPAWGHLQTDEGRLPLRDNRLIIGRADTADVRVHDDSVSRRHAVLWREGGDVHVHDLGSANGTLVNGKAISRPTVIRGEDSLILGEVAARMVLG